MVSLGRLRSGWVLGSCLRTAAAVRWCWLWRVIAMRSRQRHHSRAAPSARQQHKKAAKAGDKPPKDVPHIPIIGLKGGQSQQGNLRGEPEALATDGKADRG